MVKASCFVGVATATALALAVGCSSGIREEQDETHARLPSTAGLVISQVYTGGAATGTPYSHSFVEIFNRSAWTLSLDGVAIQYAADNALFDAARLLKLPNKELRPGQYFLVQLGSSAGRGGRADGGGPSAELAGVDATFDVKLSLAAGKVALVRAPMPACGNEDAPCNPKAAVNFVTYGEDGAEALTPAMAAKRLDDGCTETGDIVGDFEITAPSPRNSTTPPHVCAGGPPPPPVDGGASLVLLSEIEVAPQGGITGSPWGYAEILCTPKASLANYYFVATDPTGIAAVIVDLKTRACAAAAPTHPDVGLVYIKAPGTAGHLSGEGQTLVLPALPATSTLGAAGNGAFMIVKSTAPILEGTDFDPSDDGTIQLPAGAVVVDGITFAPTTGTVPKYVPRPEQPATGAVAATRLVDNVTPLSDKAWFTGALKGNPDSVDYDPAVASANLPAGAVLTPGKINFKGAAATNNRDAGAHEGGAPAVAGDDGGTPTHVSSTTETTAAPAPPASAPPPSSAESVCAVQPGPKASMGFAAFAIAAMAAAFGLRRRQRAR